MKKTIAAMIIVLALTGCAAPVINRPIKAANLPLVVEDSNTRMTHEIVEAHKNK